MPTTPASPAPCLKKEKEANARLIAAAPDMLAALKTVRENIDMEMLPDSPKNDAMILAIDDAIAKAER